MLIKEEKGQWSARINFIDKNDAFVGFDSSGQCCEDFGWYVSERPFGAEINASVLESDAATFDTKMLPRGANTSEDDGGGTVAFRVIVGYEIFWLNLYCHHNGYYSHGWDSSFGGEGEL